MGDPRQPKLEGVYAKLDRADELGQELKSAIGAYLDKRPFRLVSTPDSTGERCELRAAISTPIPTVSWGVR